MPSASSGTAATIASSLGDVSMWGSWAMRSISLRRRSSARASAHAPATALPARAVLLQAADVTRASSRASAMNENAARPMSTRPRHAKPTRNVPAVEKSDRASSPKSSPTSPDAAWDPNAVRAGPPTWTSAAVTTPISKSPAIRPAVTGLALPRTSGIPTRKSSSGSAHATTPTSDTSQPASSSPTGPTQLSSG